MATNIDQLLEKQKVNYDNIKQITSNYAKDTVQRKIFSYLEKRLEALEAHWAEFSMNHGKLAPLVTPDMDYVIQVNAKLKKVVGKHDDKVGGEEHEITAQISVPHEGGWGWLVVFSAFFSIFILDGVAYTFGSMLADIAKDLKVSDSLVALVNSTAVALYFIASPLASAFINRFGFRECAMCGSIICSFALLTSYFTKKIGYLFLFYGIIAGFGYSLINMSSGLVVGFYFERLRSVALAIATCGSSFGVMSLFPVNTYLVKLAGWRTTMLLHSGLFGIIFFLGMAYRPLLSFTVTKTEQDPTRTVAYLPSVTSAVVRPTTSRTGVQTPKPTLAPTATERLFSAVSNVNFPMAAAVVEDIQPPDMIPTGHATTAQAGPSSAVARSKSRLTFTAHGTEGAIYQKQLQRVESIISKASDKSKAFVEVSIIKPPTTKKKMGFWARLFTWEPRVPQARPLYRDDAFYEGKLTDLPAYQKSMVDTSAPGRTGLEYQMAVTRAVTVNDLQEHRGVFTTALRRVLATMMDPNLLKKSSFLLMCCSGFFTYLGFLVPYVYLQDRNLKAGVDASHCNLFISAIGLSNAIGRLVLGSLASKIDPIYLFAVGCTVAGLSTIVSGVSYNLYYQYAYCFVFGFSISSVACLRSIILVSLYGLDKLTNATGMMLIFLGLGNLVSTPIAGILKNTYGYELAFTVAGAFMTVSGLILILVKFFAVREIKAQAQQDTMKTKMAQGRQQRK
ncbi:uncharacterized protein LOC126372658 [Pectinophora gossypiella]|uniref:uncharacterized protein LOC126372658 n=1 Tax=Pectinophora gossypiella TaxID=13191 RepID=UPI00214F1803|nr:uncharacterized protein LOC126372658 [Pectinophora gossypiella]